MAQFRRGVSAITEAAQRGGGGKFTPTFKFEAGETKYIQFLTAIEDVPTVLMHQYIIVGQREDGSDIYERFISRKDPSLDGPQGYDDLVDRFGLSPSQRCVALAVELKPVYGASKGGRKTISSFELEERQFERDDETVTVPAFGLVIESPFTFFTHLAAFADVKGIDEVIFGVRRTGKSTDTTYTFIDTGKEPLDVEAELETFEASFNFEEWLENLTDEDRMREMIGTLPDDAKVTMYPPKKGKKEESRRNSRSRRSVVSEDEVAEVEVEVEDDLADADEVRSRRFSELRNKVGASK